MKFTLVALIFLSLMGVSFAADNQSMDLSLGSKKGFEMIDNGDTAGAIKEFDKACEAGDGFACSVLGVVYIMGDGTNNEPEKAVAAYSKGCDLKESSGCYSAAKMYLEGYGVKEDKAKGVSLLDKACVLGNQDACDFKATHKK